MRRGEMVAEVVGNLLIVVVSWAVIFLIVALAVRRKVEIFDQRLIFWGAFPIIFMKVYVCPFGLVGYRIEFDVWSLFSGRRSGGFNLDGDLYTSLLTRCSVPFALERILVHRVRLSTRFGDLILRVD